MQVKKFEAPTIQEALETVKRELGPEAIILQTKKNRRGFGLLSKSSIEITAAISDRSLNRKNVVESRIKDPDKEALRKLPAEKQADLIDKYTHKNLENVSKTKEQVQLSGPSKKITATRYIDIQDEAGRIGFSGGSESTKTPNPSHLRMPQQQPSLGTNLEDEVLNLKKMIEELKKGNLLTGLETSGNHQYLGKLDMPILQEAFEELILNGVERKYAYLLLKKVSFELGSDQLARIDTVLDILVQEMMQSIEISTPFKFLSQDENEKPNAPMILSLVGSTGVGKTMTLAKLASVAAHKRKFKVGLINLDFNGHGSSFEQLGTYARILNLPFRSVSTLEDLNIALLDFQNADVVMIDAPGCSQKDMNSLRKIEGLIKSIPEIQVFLTLSCTTRDTELYEITNRFSNCKPRGLVFTKLDESAIYGSIYNVAQRSKLPLSFFTTGQNLPEDIEEATKERLVSLILNL